MSSGNVRQRIKKLEEKAQPSDPPAFRLWWDNGDGTCTQARPLYRSGDAEPWEPMTVTVEELGPDVIRLEWPEVGP
jgi:hypothetical protein